jgi:hypothetical protein
MKLTLVAVMSSILLQSVASPKDLLTLQRPLTGAEMDAVVNAIHQALAGMTLRLRQDRQADIEILMGPAGMPHMVRRTYDGAGPVERIATVTTETGAGVTRTVRIPSVPEHFILLSEYTGLQASHCSGAPATGEMIIEYTINSTTQIWTATARERRSGDTGIALPLNMLRSTAALRSGESRLIGNRTARAIVSPWPLFNAQEPFLTGDPAPNPAEFVPLQSLWVDTSSLLPVRWELSQRDAIIGGFDFVYEPLEFQRPADIEAPKCIPEHP